MVVAGSSHGSAGAASDHSSGGRAATALGLVGELAVTAGVVLLLFLVWELWWTDVVADREQAGIVAALPWQQPPTDPAHPDRPRIAAPRPGDPPVLKEPDEGTTFAILQVPRWGDRRRPVSQGVSVPRVLNPKGIGHYPGTAMPGEVGNFATAGHRTTYGKPYSRIDQLRRGDALVVRTKAVWYVYRVSSTAVVRPGETEVVAPVPGDSSAVPTERYLTMTTCHPRFSAARRYVVHARFAYWAAVSDGVPAELVADPPKGD